jgi:MATE family multidrug resistance protein
MSLSSLRGHVRSHTAGPGGIAMLLGIALPMMISSSAETVMMFADRLFLSTLGREHLSAALSGGLTSFTLMTFALGVLGYVNALVAQYLGAGRKHQCGVATAQGLILGAVAFPLMLMLVPLACWLLGRAGHDPLQHELEVSYLRILSFGMILSLLRAPLAGFFTGIGRTRVVMIASIAAMVVNIPANYVLIFGHFGAPALGIVGAACGTLIGSVVALAIMLSVYFSLPMRQDYGTVAGLSVDIDMLKRLLRFGVPSGVEFFLNLAAFNLFVQLFHSYGKDAAAAITITFNWDLIAFLPMMGFNVGVMSLVGRYLGGKQPDLAKRSVFSGLKVAIIYGVLMSIAFLGFPEFLVGVFTKGERAAAEYANVFPLAVATLRLAAVYTLLDGVLMVFDGALRGGGDTRWTMRASVTIHWLMALGCAYMITVAKVPPIVSWSAFICLIFALTAALGLRFMSGKWMSFDVIGDGGHFDCVENGTVPPDVMA